jgi:hypothetical protein
MSPARTPALRHHCATCNAEVEARGLCGACATDGVARGRFIELTVALLAGTGDRDAQADEARRLSQGWGRAAVAWLIGTAHRRHLEAARVAAVINQRTERAMRSRKAGRAG